MYPESAAAVWSYDVIYIYNIMCHFKNGFIAPDLVCILNV